MANSRMYLVNTDTGLAVGVGTFGCGGTGWSAPECNALDSLYRAVEKRMGLDVYWPRPHYILTCEGCLCDAVRLPDIPGLWQLPAEMLAKLPKGV